jgi:DNA-binding NarL/FixJ family response regulator
MPSFRVLVVDDHEAVRKGVCAILAAHGELEVCGEASSGTEAVAKTTTLRPELVVMDISMPGMDGISAAREILKLYPDTRIIILSMHDSKQLIEGARKVGVRGYVTKGQAGSALLDAIDAIVHQHDFFPS